MNKKIAEIDDKFESMMKMAVYPITAANYGSAGALYGGIALLAGTLGYGLMRRRAVKNNQFLKT